MELINYKKVELHQKELIALRDINLTVNTGELIYLTGRVGSGKSTLLKSFYAEVPIYSCAQARVMDYDLLTIKRKEIPYLRRKMGIVFQDFQLLKDRNIEANLEFVLQATGWKDKDKIQECLNHALRRVGMEKKSYKKPHELSGGEQQRVAIARALLNEPSLILADEPTGNLDSQTGEEIMSQLADIAQSGTAVIVATHNLTWPEKFAGRVLNCQDKKVI